MGVGCTRFGLIAAGLMVLSAVVGAREAVAQYPYQTATAYGYGVHYHADGMGRTIKRGNEQLEQYIDGTEVYYQRQGAMEFRQNSNGGYGHFYYDGARGVTQYDFRNMRTGVRTYGENPYPNNPYGYRWQQQTYGW